ncbi:MAG: hypothetical protein ABI336_11175 [Humibacillus sp.]
MELPDPVVRLAREQWGVVTRSQLLEAGVPAAALRWHVGRRWRALLPGVILLAPGLPTTDQQLAAALLAAGPSSWLSGRTAAVWHGLVAGPQVLPVQVMVPFPATSRRIAWVSVRATSLTGERLVHRGPLRLASRPRSLVDAAAQAPDASSCRAMIIAAVQDRLVRVDDVQHWVAVRRRNGTTRLKEGVMEAAAGAWSLPEAQLGIILGRSGLFPHLMANPSLVDANGRLLTTPDVWLDDVAVAAMVHSRRFHSGALNWDATVEADEDLREAGVEVVGLTPSSIERRPDRVLARVHSVHDRASRRPRPPVLATPRDWMRRAPNGAGDPGVVAPTSG